MEKQNGINNKIVSEISLEEALKYVLELSTIEIPHTYLLNAILDNLTGKNGIIDPLSPKQIDPSSPVSLTTPPNVVSNLIFFPAQ